MAGDHDRGTGIVAVVLAAGAGTRFEGAGHKLDAVIDDRTILDRAVGAALAAGIGPVVVVTAAQVATALPPRSSTWSTSGGPRGR